MSEHHASVHWQLDGPSFAAQQYSRRHVWHFDGGATVAASSSPHVVPVPWSDPAAVDPEEAFVASLSSCHMLWFLDLASRAGWAVERYDDAAVGVMGRNALGRVAMTQVTLRPTVVFAPGRGPDDTTLHSLHHSAHERCFIANSVKTELRCEPVLPS